MQHAGAVERGSLKQRDTGVQLGLYRRIARYCAAVGALGTSAGLSAQAATIYSGARHLPITEAGTAVDIEGDGVTDFVLRWIRYSNGPWPQDGIFALPPSHLPQRPDNRFLVSTGTTRINVATRTFTRSTGSVVVAHDQSYFCYAVPAASSEVFSTVASRFSGTWYSSSSYGAFFVNRWKRAQPGPSSTAAVSGAWTLPSWRSAANATQDKTLAAFFRFAPSGGSALHLGAMRIRIPAPAGPLASPTAFSGAEVVDWIWSDQPLNTTPDFHVDFSPFSAAAPVPEPSSLGLLAAGAAGVAALRRRRRRRPV
ncbi:MAG: PEP-CTERM sorting domain-containing protein [Planctomycetota bacterium]|nr:MAG: PEP-CTERM sorting domain-containing protein [Planctomycetota bacterium]